MLMSRKCTWCIDLLNGVFATPVGHWVRVRPTVMRNYVKSATYLALWRRPTAICRAGRWRRARTPVQPAEKRAHVIASCEVYGGHKSIYLQPQLTATCWRSGDNSRHATQYRPNEDNQVRNDADCGPSGCRMEPDGRQTYCCSSHNSTLTLFCYLQVYQGIHVRVRKN